MSDLCDTYVLGIPMLRVFGMGSFAWIVASLRGRMNDIDSRIGVVAHVSDSALSGTSRRSENTLKVS